MRFSVMTISKPGTLKQDNVECPCEGHLQPQYGVWGLRGKVPQLFPNTVFVAVQWNVGPGSSYSEEQTLCTFFFSCGSVLAPAMVLIGL